MGSKPHGLYPRGFSGDQVWSWPLVPAHKLVKLNYGKALRAVDRTEGDVPVYGTNGQCGTHDRHLVEGPGVILGRKGQGPLGVEWCDDDYWVIDTAYYVTRESERIDLRYFYYLTKYIGLNHLKDGTSNPSLSRDTFGLLLLPLPPVSTQERIAEILSMIDDKIELNRRMNATLEEMAQALFKSWFVDFEPVIDNALAAGNPIPDELVPRAEVRKKALESGNHSLSGEASAKAGFPAAFQFTEELGWIPEGWETQPLYDIADFVNGAAYNGADFSEAEDALPVVKIAEVKAGITGQTKFTTINKGDKYRVEDGDILLSWSGTPDTSIDTFIWTNGPGFLNQHIFNVRLHDESERHFVYYQLKYLRSTFAEIARDKQTTGLGHFTAGDMKRLMVFKPTTFVLEQFNAAVSSIYSRAYENRITTKTLAKLRDTLIPKLISGKLKTAQGE